MTAQEADDVRLVEEFRRGSASAFDELFRRHSGRVRTTCMRMVSDRTTAEDLTQETFMRVLNSIDSVTDQFKVGAWINRIATNLCNDELRRRHRRNRRVHQNNDAVDEALLRFPDLTPEANPEDALEQHYLRSLVWEVGKQLPERQRMVLTLRELQGLSYSSIARVMGISESAVETLLHRARQRFKRLFLDMDAPTESRTDCERFALFMHLPAREWTDEAKNFIESHTVVCQTCQKDLAARPA